MSDFFVFGGILSKDHISLGYIKTSPKGKKLYAGALLTDEIRRFATMLILQIINFVVAIILYNLKISQVLDPEELVAPDNIAELISILFFYYLLSLICIQICRHFTVIAANVAAAYLVSMLGSIFLFAVSSVVSSSAIFIAGCILLSIVMIIIKQLTALKKMEESYYDK